MVLYLLFVVAWGWSKWWTSYQWT